MIGIFLTNNDISLLLMIFHHFSIWQLTFDNLTAKVIVEKSKIFFKTFP